MGSISDSVGQFVEHVPGFMGAIVVSIACGLVIGLERESRGKPAGARTLVLICLGSAIFVQLSMILAGPNGDQGRVAAQIVTGIGFLGAGAILHQTERGYIAGLTTAATVWVTAAIGMLVGSGKYVYGVIAVIAAVLSLRALRQLEKMLFVTKHIEGRRIFFDPKHGKTEWQLLGMLEDHLINPSDYKFFSSSAEHRPFLELDYNKNNRNHRSFLSDIAELDVVIEIEKTEPSHRNGKNGGGKLR